MDPNGTRIAPEVLCMKCREIPQELDFFPTLRNL